ncbi:hypothetical protein D3C85_1789990 [compost metagenome]
MSVICWAAAGWAWEKSGVNQRAIEASRRATIAAGPSRNTVSMRGFQTEDSPIFAAVLQTTSESRRELALIPSH